MQAWRCSDSLGPDWANAGVIAAFSRRKATRKFMNALTLRLNGDMMMNVGLVAGRLIVV